MLKLLEAADYFQMAGLKEMCGRLLINMISCDNCLKLMDMACKYDVKNLKPDCMKFFVKNREKVLEKNPNLKEVVTNIPPLGLEFLGLKLKDES